MKIDDTTGLPELPEGHFWRVTRDSAGLLVQIRKKRIVGSTCVHYRYFFPRMHDGDAKTAIKLSAKTCLERLNERREDWANAHLVTELFGDYPPNKLG